MGRFMFKFLNTMEEKELTNSYGKIKSGLTSIFTGKKLNDELLEELEDLLISSDIGIAVVENIIDFLRKNRYEKEITTNDVKKIIFQKLSHIFNGIHDDIVEFNRKSYVLMFVGVNGSGKTTMIGKLANELKKNNKKVLLAACDTFRAGAAEQLEVWKERARVDIIKGEGEHPDPASVAYKALQKAKAENYDVLMIDTAGRLQNNINLMAELVKIENVLKKIDENIEDSKKNILVLDATTGQNAVKQFELFDKSININGVIMNKMDGTSKGGILVSLVEKFRKPIYAVGIGEKIDDIKNFSANEYLKHLVGMVGDE